MTVADRWVPAALRRDLDSYRRSLMALGTAVATASLCLPLAAAIWLWARPGERWIGTLGTLLTSLLSLVTVPLLRWRGLAVAGNWLVGLLFVGLTCLAMLILLLQGFGVWLLLQRGLALGWALLTMGGIDALVGVVAILLGRRALARPLLPETRALIRRTLATVIS